MADTAIFPNLTIQSADEKVIITMHTVQKALQLVGYVSLKAKSMMEKEAQSVLKTEV